MLNNKQLFIFISFFIFQFSSAQKPQKWNAVEIHNQIQKLNFLGSVLYIAAHPDDENTRLISYLSNEKKARTAYLSLTRGDGGQNLIGSELRELLGVIRTQELIEARKIDGGEQFFSRANDFGFSKNPDETFEIWDKEKVLADVVWAIRKFRPDVIINRFDHRSPGTTHGHHTASAILSVESFDLSNNPKSFPEQLKHYNPWQPKRLFFNPSVWFYGSQEKFDAADKSNFITLETGVYYAGLGKSNQEIAALSRSSHKSQGFGSTGSRGKESEYLELIDGEKIKDKANLFDGIDTSWNRIKNGKEIGELVTKIETDFNFSNPAASVPDLVKAYTLIADLDENHWKTVKLEELKNIITACSGLYLEAVSNVQQTTPGSTIQLRIEAINRSITPVELNSITAFPSQKNTVLNKVLNNNFSENFSVDLELPENLEYSQPYWLKEKGTTGMYQVSEQKNIGIPDIIRNIKLQFNLKINGIAIPVERTVVYKYNDKVNGEMYNYLDIIPEVSTRILDQVSFFNDGKTKKIAVQVKAGKDNIDGNVRLEVAENWIVDPLSTSFNLEKKEHEKTVYFDVTPPENTSEIIAKSVAVVNSKEIDKEQIIIDYDHISKQQVLLAAESKFKKLDLKITNERIGYIMGAGDEVPECLIQMGYPVTLLTVEEDINTRNLNNFDVIITGIRAYNVLPTLKNRQHLLLEFVKRGKTLIVQYNTPDRNIPNNIAPYPLTISSDRVTDENATVQFLAPNHAILNYPNKITEKDFKGWTQEQGLYYPNQFDAAFTPILSSHDKGETDKKGALLVAAYGKGHYIYTGLSLFRELPMGVSGAYRLVANMISLKTAETEEAPK
ncbi:GlcNAc-PI de-N-acetylase [Flavobacterium flevense]|uniref:PIG-L domain-containing protein n=1 Tax=Flavobacterium flevense TaxID=983 RepID=A0A4Y4AT73_9FLAO|nr:PIG-L family deacetylase [Flavobacterium flevense]GEC71428.1 PIG-L domain-containing protein [Flavobacterium flevense]SHL79029.1 GlcNAc-PI de-N-acetylase [Flavobacterium flevense]